MGYNAFALQFHPTNFIRFLSRTGTPPVTGMSFLGASHSGVLFLVAIGLERLERGRGGRTKGSFLLLSLPLIELRFEPMNFFPQAIGFALLLHTALAQIDSIVRAFACLLFRASSHHRFILSSRHSGSYSLSPSLWYYGVLCFCLLERCSVY
jgi:hypothetical protein